MRTNHSVERLESKIKYVKNALEVMEGVAFLTRELKKLEEALVEAKRRRIVGFDINTKKKAYIVGEEGNEYIYVEDTPSGYSISRDEVVEGRRKEICYDGGTEWFGCIVFTTTLKR